MDLFGVDLVDAIKPKGWKVSVHRSRGPADPPWKAEARGILAGVIGFGQTKDEAFDNLGLALAEARLPDLLAGLGFRILDAETALQYPAVFVERDGSIRLVVIARSNDRERAGAMAEREAAEHATGAAVVVIGPEATRSVHSLNLAV